MTCIYCNSMIDNDRLEFLQETGRRLVCIDCSVETKALGWMDYGHKTAPQLVMVPANAKETIRKLDRANRRAR